MTRIKKNYAIDEQVVELINEVAKALNMKPCEVIEGVVRMYSPMFYKNTMELRAKDNITFARLMDLAGIGYDSAELFPQYDGEEEGAL